MAQSDVSSMNNRCFGIYRGIVTDNEDPSGRKKIRVQIPMVLGKSESWAVGCVPLSATSLPEVGTDVWIEFEGGDPSYPVWVGVVLLP